MSRPQWRIKPRTDHNECQYRRSEQGAIDAAWDMAKHREWLGRGMNRVYVQYRDDPMSRDWHTMHVVHGYGNNRQITPADDWDEDEASLKEQPYE